MICCVILCVIVCVILCYHVLHFDDFLERCNQGEVFLLLTLSVWDRLETSGSDVYYRRQNLTSIDVRI